MVSIAGVALDADFRGLQKVRALGRDSRSANPTDQAYLSCILWRDREVGYLTIRQAHCR